MIVDVLELMINIREYVNSTHAALTYKLISNKDKWNQLCVCMDHIERCQQIIVYYKDSGYTEDVGGDYIKIYGLFQAMYIQQDCVRYLLNNIGVEINQKNFNSEFSEIRKFRDSFIGHPGDDGKGYHSLFVFNKNMIITGSFIMRPKNWNIN